MENKKIKKLNLLIILILLIYSDLLQSQDCNGNIINCPYSQTYPYRECVGTSVVTRCAKNPSDITGNVLQTYNLPICVDIMESHYIEQAYMCGVQVFDINEAKNEMIEACKQWNCICDVPYNNDCDTKINFIFSNSSVDFPKSESKTLAKAHFAWFPISCRINPYETEIRFNNSIYFLYGDDMTAGDLKRFFINQRFINDENIAIITKKDDYGFHYVYSFLHIVKHEFGHILGFGHTDECGGDECSVMQSGSSWLSYGDGKDKGLCDYDKCMFAKLYCPGLIGIHYHEPQAQKVYPNPGEHTVSINFTLPDYCENVKMYIQNPLGQVVFVPIENIAFEGGEHTELINVDSLPTGTYYIIIEAGTYRTAKPFIIKK